MAKSREAALKRAREKARLDKREAKQAKKAAKAADSSETEAPNEEALWEQFAKLSQLHDAGQISNDDYETQRQAIMESLGIESGE